MRVWSVLLLAAISCSEAEVEPPPENHDVAEPVPETPLEFEWIFEEPPLWPPEKALPLVVALHGRGSTPEAMLELIDLSTPARVVAPRGHLAAGDGYAWFPPGPEGRDLPDIERITRGLADVVRMARRKFRTTGMPVFTGFSQGGAVTYAMTSYRPDLLRAGVPIGGWLPTKHYPKRLPLDVKGGPQLIAMHGEADDVIVVTQTLEAVRAFENAGWRARAATYPDIKHSIPQSMRKDLIAVLDRAVSGQPLLAPNTEHVPGWAGFVRVAEADDAWAETRGSTLSRQLIADSARRTVKVIVATGEVTISRADSDASRERYCAESAVRAWNAELCDALDARTCQGEECTMAGYTSCSGILVGEGRLVTAGSCVAGLRGDDQLRAASRAVVPTRKGAAGKRLVFGELRLGKGDYQHGGVALGEEFPLDVAVIAVDDSELQLPRVPALGLIPSDGEVMFSVGYPDLSRRGEDGTAERHREGFGVPGVSMGRIADRNTAKLPLCSFDGRRETWNLAEPCPEGEIEYKGEPAWRGVITRRPVLSTNDATSEMRGAPLFDTSGRLYAIHVATIGGGNPDKVYSRKTRSVSVPIREALALIAAPAKFNPVDPQAEAPVPPAEK